METARRLFNRMIWWKQIIPRTLYTIYRDEQEGGRRYFGIWRQWLGRAYDFRRIPLTGMIFLAALVSLVLFPNLALAQEANDGGGFVVDLLSGDKVVAYLLALLALVELAKRVVAMVPGKPYNTQIGVVEGLLRKALDFIAGKNGDPADPSLIKKE